MLLKSFLWHSANIYNLADIIHAPGKGILWLSEFTQGADNKWNFATGAGPPRKALKVWLLALEC